MPCQHVNTEPKAAGHGLGGRGRDRMSAVALRAALAATRDTLAGDQPSSPCAVLDTGAARNRSIRSEDSWISANMRPGLCSRNRSLKVSRARFSTAREDVRLRSNRSAAWWLREERPNKRSQLRVRRRLPTSPETVVSFAPPFTPSLRAQPGPAQGQHNGRRPPAWLTGTGTRKSSRPGCPANGGEGDPETAAKSPLRGPPVAHWRQSRAED